ncbi:MAG: cytochrome P450 [Pseudomonadota bacterium]|nr:cytochrome P450 [Pseudomonadota bacterium]
MKFDYPSPDTAECPYPLYAEARQTCPVVRVPTEEVAHFVSRYEDVVHVIRNPEIFSSEARAIGTQPVDRGRTPGGLGINALLDSDPPDHFHHRRISTRTLNAKTFAASEPMVRKHVDALIDGFIDRGTCEFIGEFGERLPERVITELMGFPPDFSEKLKNWGQIEVQGIKFYSEERKRHQMAVFEDFQDTIEAELVKRSETPANDALGDLVRDQIERDGSFNLDYVKAQAVILAAGGLITTGHMMGHLMYLLLTHPDQLQAVLDDPALITRALNETVRLETPIQWVPRRVTQDTELHGVSLKAGTHILIGLGSANRDPEKFADPDRFDIHRKGLNQHLGFGNGTHFCLGAPLAKLEATVALQRLFERLKNIRLSDRNDYRHTDSPAFRGLQSLWLDFDAA